MRIISPGINNGINISIVYNKEKIQELINIIIEDFTDDRIKPRYEQENEIEINDQAKFSTFIYNLEKNHLGKIADLKEIKENGKIKYRFKIKKYPKIVKLLYKIIEEDKFDEVFKEIFKQRSNAFYNLFDEVFTDNYYKKSTVNNNIPNKYLLDEKSITEIKTFYDVIKEPGKEYNYITNRHHIIEPRHYIRYFLERCLCIGINNKRIKADEDIITANELINLGIYPNFENHNFEAIAYKESYKLSVKTNEHFGKRYDSIPIKDIFILNDFRRYLDSKFRVLKYRIEYYEGNNNFDNKTIDGSSYSIGVDEETTLKELSPGTFLEQAEEYRLCKRKEIEEENAEAERRYKTREALVDKRIKETAEKKYEEIILKGPKRNK